MYLCWKNKDKRYKILRVLNINGDSILEPLSF